MFILWNKGYFSYISAYLPLLNKFFMQPPIKPTVYKPTQSHSECCSFKPLLSYPYSLLLPLSKVGKKNPKPSYWTPHFFATGQNFILQWNFKAFITVLHIKCNPEQSHTSQKLFQVTIKIILNIHLSVHYNCPCCSISHSRAHTG